jgi:Cu/Ag efflux pump CusA
MMVPGILARLPAEGMASKDGLIKQIEAEATKLPGNKMGFSQPIEMRFNGLIAGEPTV